MTNQQMHIQLGRLARLVTDSFKTPARITKEELREYILSHLTTDESLEYAIANFARFSPIEMKEMHADTGLTREQVLCGYVEERSLYLAARNWIENLPL